VVLASNFPYAIDWTQRHVPAILHLTHASQEQGSALADVLFGDYDPAGRLVQTWPAAMAQLPPLMDYDIRHGRTYMYFKGRPLYPFGYGLSYTRFEYSGLSLDASRLAADGVLDVSFQLRNAGSREGEEVAQLYVQYPDSKVSRPERALKAFARVPLAAYEFKTVHLQLRARDLAWWDESRHRFVVEAGRVRLLVGASSADIRLRGMVGVDGG
jgi:beta-glucosidase